MLLDVAGFHVKEVGHCLFGLTLLHPGNLHQVFKADLPGGTGFYQSFPLKLKAGGETPSLPA